MDGTDNAALDLTYVDFSVDNVIEPFLDAASVVARSMDVQSPLNLQPEALRVATTRVDELGLSDLICELDSETEVISLLFHMARVLAYSNVEVTWRSLASIPALLLGGEGAIQRVAFPENGATQWTIWLPDVGALFSLHLGLLRPTAIEYLPDPEVDSQSCHGLLGFNAGAVVILHRPTRGKAAAALTDVSTSVRDRYLRAEQALLLGMIVGVCWRMSDDAYKYAMERMSAGKPIAQHQAVALRLGDIALDYQALSLYCAAHVKPAGRQGGLEPPPGLASHFVESTAFRIGRDCVQVAAAHGYVEGLSFKRHYEQLRTLSSALISLPHPSRA